MSLSWCERHLKGGQTFLLVHLVGGGRGGQDNDPYGPGWILEIEAGGQPPTLSERREERR